MAGQFLCRIQDGNACCTGREHTASGSDLEWEQANISMTAKEQDCTLVLNRVVIVVDYKTAESIRNQLKVNVIVMQRMGHPDQRKWTVLKVQLSLVPFHDAASYSNCYSHSTMKWVASRVFATRILSGPNFSKVYAFPRTTVRILVCAIQERTVWAIRNYVAVNCKSLNDDRAKAIRQKRISSNEDRSSCRLVQMLNLVGCETFIASHQSRPITELMQHSSREWSITFLSCWSFVLHNLYSSVDCHF